MNSFEDIQKTLDLAGQELRILHQISHTISCTLDLDEVLRQIIELVVEVTKGDSCLLYLLDSAGDFMTLRASKNPHPRLIGKVAVKVGEGITGWVAQEAVPVAIARHASKDSRFKFFHTLPEDRYEAFLSVPIVAPTDRVIGVINVQHRKAHRHSDREKTLLSIIGHQVGSAIQNARLFEETSHRSRQISTLAQVGQLISSGKYLEEMLQLIVRMIAEMLQARVVSIMLVDTQRNELVLKAAKCSSEEYWQRPNLKIGKSLISRVVKERGPLMVRDVTKEAEYLYPELATKEGVKSLVSVPMVYKDHTIGVINVYSAEERVFSKEDVRVLSTVADQAALAIENTKLSVAVQESQEALQARKMVERAKSILQRQAHLTEEEAYKRLQQQSMRTRRSMKEIAEAVILSNEIQAAQ
ncbi:MAG TPA: GAF domain-containing protein [Terriglobia bacterium]|nr:GAF domain-containing protein [Terriglobia bacterium]